MSEMMGKDVLERLWSDPAHWTRGDLYRCAADPRLMVLKRVGAGYTINIAHRRSWFILIGLLAVTLWPVPFFIVLGSRAPEWLLVTLLWPMVVVVITLIWLSRRDDS